MAHSCPTINMFWVCTEGFIMLASNFTLITFIGNGIKNKNFHFYYNISRGHTLMTSSKILRFWTSSLLVLVIGNLQYNPLYWDVLYNHHHHLSLYIKVNVKKERQRKKKGFNTLATEDEYIRKNVIRKIRTMDIFVKHVIRRIRTTNIYVLVKFLNLN